MPVENPNSRWFVVTDNGGNCIAKYNTNAPVVIPVDEYKIIELSSQSELENYVYDETRGYQ